MALPNQPNGVLVLSPGHPGHNAPGLLLASVFASRPVLRVPKASIAIGSDLAEVAIGYPQMSAPAGTLFVSGKNYLVAGLVDNHDVALFDVATGHFAGEDGSRLPAFKSWSIEVPGSDGTMRRLCEVRADGWPSLEAAGGPGGPVLVNRSSSRDAWQRLTTERTRKR